MFSVYAPSIRSKIIAAIFCASLFCFSGAVYAADTQPLQRFDDVRFIESPANDGDSFLVEAGHRQIHLRLYFVDSPESRYSNEDDLHRLREQTQYFGLSAPETTLGYGREASRYVKQRLAKPFTIHTAFVDALGRSRSGRVYGFVTTSTGEDLSSLLVAQGLARTYGRGRETPNGKSPTQMFRTLHDIQETAMSKGIGIWSKSDPLQMAFLKEKYRDGDRAKLQRRRSEKRQEDEKGIDLNRASKAELQSIKGIGPVLAERIVSGRPYRKIDDLNRIQGIGPKKLNRLRPYFVVRKE